MEGGQHSSKAGDVNEPLYGVAVHKDFPERGQRSCAECRRLKIRCDKRVPCMPCQKRNISNFCPDGTRATRRKEIQSVLETTKPLYQRIDSIKKRIHQLEEELSRIYSQSSLEPHPLLRNGFDMEEFDINLNGESASEDGNVSQVIDGFGSLSVSNYGNSRFFGVTGACASLIHHSNCKIDTQLPSEQPALYNSDANVPLFFSNSFPLFAPSDKSSNILEFIESFLPPYEQALGLCTIYFDTPPWLLDGSASWNELVDEIFPKIYYHPSIIEDSIGRKRPHDVAYVFIVLAIVMLPDAELAEHFYQLAMAALALQPVLERPSIVTLQTLSLIADYKGITASYSDPSYARSVELLWSIRAMVAHLAQAIGLHRDSANWNFPEKTSERRRNIFWVLFKNNMWESLYFGRPPCFSTMYIDCKFPTVKEGDNIMKCQVVKWRMTVDLVPDLLMCVLGKKTLTYENVMELDKRVRDYSLSDNGETSSYWPEIILKNWKATLLVFLHSVFLARAIILEPEDPLKSPYASSIFSSLRASTAVLQATYETLDSFISSSKITRAWFVWRNAFTATVVIGVIAAKFPRAPWAQFALTEFDRACKLFQELANRNTSTNRTLPVLAKLMDFTRDSVSASLVESALPKNNPLFVYNKQEEGNPVYEILLSLSGIPRLTYSNLPLARNDELFYPMQTTEQTEELSQFNLLFPYYPS